jgi:site-specific DNA recombinase
VEAYVTDMTWFLERQELAGNRINVGESSVVQRIFHECTAGLSPRSIARRLNQEGITGPSGRAWRDTTIRGHFGRGTGILNNELYVGRLVWNRLTYRKDPTTGRRRSRHNAPEKWIAQDVPALRIVDDDADVTRCLLLTDRKYGMAPGALSK